MNTGSCNDAVKITQAKFTRNLSNQWKSLPNLRPSQKCETLKEKRLKLRNRTDTLVPGVCWRERLERSKSMDFATKYEIDLSSYEEETEVNISTFDLYLSKDFTDLMNTSFSERSELDSTDEKVDFEESIDAWTELQSSQLTRSNLTQSLATRMYSYENLDRVGRNLYKINKWFQRCSFDDTDTDKTNS